NSAFERERCRVVTVESHRFDEVAGPVAEERTRGASQSCQYKLPVLSTCNRLIGAGLEYFANVCVMQQLQLRGVSRNAVGNGTDFRHPVMIDHGCAPPALLDARAGGWNAATRLARDHDAFKTRIAEIDGFLAGNFCQPQCVGWRAAQKTGT